MGRIYSKHGEIKNTYRTLVAKLEVTEEDRGIDGRLISKKHCLRLWIMVLWLRTEFNTALNQRFPYKVVNQLFKVDPIAWS
jgi:hypothetical protein